MKIKNKKRVVFRLFFLVILLISIKVLFYKIDLTNPYIIDLEYSSQKTMNPIKLFDLKKSLTPIDDYEAIKCVKSKIIDTETILCVNDRLYIIHQLENKWKKHVFNEDLVVSFVNAIVECLDCLVFDIGAKFGQYSLLAARMGRDVLAVEPFNENVLRIHKASKLQNISDRITLITNFLSNKKGKMHLYHPNGDVSGKIGDFSHQEYENFDFNMFKIKNKKEFLVKTIIFDDIIKYIPVKNGINSYRKAIMKLDLDGFEVLAIQNASLLFDHLEILVIYMEWGNIALQTDLENETENLLDFLYSRNYKPFNRAGELERKLWKNEWDWNVIWRKQNY